MSEIKLPPIAEETFDGDKESTEINFVKCNHKLELISGTEAKCIKCSAGYLGHNVIELVKASQLKTPKK